MEQSLLNFDSPNLLSDEEAVLSCLGHGRQAATSSTIIEERTGLKPRRVQQVVRKLRLGHGYRIMASTRRPMGYYIAENQDEIVDNVRALMSRGIKDLMVAAKFRKMSLRMVFEQACMIAENENAEQ